MKVLHINIHLALKGGVETYLLDLFPRLKAKDIHCSFGYSQGDPSLVEDAVHIEGLESIGSAEEEEMRQRLGDLLKARRPDLVHIHNVQNVGVLRAAFDFGPTVVTNHDYRWVCPANTFFYKRNQSVCPKAGAGLSCFTTTLVKHCLTPRPRFARYFYHRSRFATEASHRFNGIIAPSRGAKQRLEDAGFPAGNITVLPYYCPIEPRKTPRPVPERRTITFMGRIAPNKGHEYFVEALGLLPEDVRGILVGNMGEEEQKYIDGLAEKHGCADRLETRHWAGREEVPRILDETSVFIFPSLWEETLGIVGLEALSRGVPVVGSDLGGVRDWLDDGVTGRLVEPKDAAGIRDGVLDLTESRVRLETAGINGIRTIQQRFLPEQHTETLIRLYQNAVA